GLGAEGQLGCRPVGDVEGRGGVPGEGAVGGVEGVGGARLVDRQAGEGGHPAHRRKRGGEIGRASGRERGEGQVDGGGVGGDGVAGRVLTGCLRRYGVVV